MTSNFRDPRPDADDTRIAYRGFQKEKEKKGSMGHRYYITTTLVARIDTKNRIHRAQARDGALRGVRDMSSFPPCSPFMQEE